MKEPRGKPLELPPEVARRFFRNESISPRAQLDQGRWDRKQAVARSSPVSKAARKEAAIVRRESDVRRVEGSRG